MRRTIVGLTVLGMLLGVVPSSEARAAEEPGFECHDLLVLFARGGRGRTLEKEKQWSSLQGCRSVLVRSMSSSSRPVTRAIRVSRTKRSAGQQISLPRILMLALPTSIQSQRVLSRLGHTLATGPMCALTSR